MIIQRCRRIFLRYFQTLILHVVYALTADTGMIHVTIYLSYRRIFYDFFMINLFKSNFLFRRNFYIAYFFVFHIIFNWRPLLRHWTPCTGFIFFSPDLQYAFPTRHSASLANFPYIEGRIAIFLSVILQRFEGISHRSVSRFQTRANNYSFSAILQHFYCISPKSQIYCKC